MNILKDLRTKKGVYQKDVAKYLGVDRTTYVKYERGYSEPNLDTIKKLANYFDVTVDFLLGEENTLDSQFNEIEFALYGEVKELTDEQKQDILDYARFKKEQWKR